MATKKRSGETKQKPKPTPNDKVKKQLDELLDLMAKMSKEGIGHTGDLKEFVDSFKKVSDMVRLFYPDVEVAPVPRDIKQPEVMMRTVDNTRQLLKARLGKTG